jgi:hypothetical protein
MKGLLLASGIGGSRCDQQRDRTAARPGRVLLAFAEDVIEQEPYIERHDDESADDQWLAEHCHHPHRVICSTDIFIIFLLKQPQFLRRAGVRRDHWACAASLADQSIIGAGLGCLPATPILRASPIRQRPPCSDRDRHIERNGEHDRKETAVHGLTASSSRHRTPTIDP